MTIQRYHIWTVGCQMNKADSLKLAAGFKRLGLEEVARPADADLVVVNTCSVREHAEDRAYSKLGTLKKLKQRNPDLRLAVMGCLVGQRTDHLRERFPYVDVFARPQMFEPILELVVGQSEDLGGEFWPTTYQIPDGPTAYVPVIHGCNKFCTYCIVPYRRGRETSRTIADVRREVEALVEGGVREVTLLGQTVEAYGHDLPGRPDLGDLMRDLSEIPALKRIRFLTSYPRDMTPRINRAVAELAKVCEWYSLPVQAGHDDTLLSMRRGYSVRDFVEKVEEVRSLMPDAGITTDVIVGYPGESEEQFRATYDLVAALRFDKVHVAAYSPRPGTIAWRTMPDDVPAEVKHERLLAIEELERGISRSIHERMVGGKQEILVEGQKDGRFYGRTRNGKLTHFDGPARTGSLVDVEITSAGDWSLQGRVVGAVSLELV